ncbi:hypothetical protein U1Q18_024578, partial [Sarracenia purpurea var. burkii]
IMLFALSVVICFGSLVLPFAWPVCQLAFVDNLGVGFAFVYSPKWLSFIWVGFASWFLSL